MVIENDSIDVAGVYGGFKLSTFYSLEYAKDSEIVGNIYENPELLKN